jgi:peptide/nickel transport system permease protein
MKILAMVAVRIAWMPPTLLGLALIVFTVSHVIPNDPARLMAGENATLEQVEALRRQYGLDQPLVTQFLRYVGDLVTGNMGMSLYTHRPVAEDLWHRLPATFELAIFAMTLAMLVGIPLGVMAALRQHSLFDHAVRIVTVGGLAMAAFWLAILLQLLFAMTLDLTPVQGRLSGWAPEPITGFYTLDAALQGDGEMLREALHHLILPTLTLAIPSTATITRFTRAGVLNVIASNFVFYQSAMGIPWRRTVWKYILRSALIGTVTQIGLVFGHLLAGAVVVETVFDWPGLGGYAVNSILNSDYTAVLSFTVFAGMVTIAVNLVVDITLAVLDPRGR